MSKLTSEQIKSDSEKWILDAGGTVLRHLPTIGLEELSLRNRSGIAQRALVLNILVHMSFGAPRQLCKEWLERHGLLGAVSASELRLLDQTGALDTATENTLRWEMESLLAAAWLAGFVEELTPTTGIPDSLASFFPNLQDNETPEAFLSKVACRSLEEIHPVLDLFYRANWHTINCNLTGKDPGPLHPGVVYCRRKMLEWATHADCDWDDVEMST